MVRALIALLALGVLAGGCTTKAKARREARIALEMGRLQAMAAQSQNANQNQGTLMIRGNVRTPIVIWQPGMTLSRAIATAHFNSVFPPRGILVVRAGVTHTVDMQRWAQGAEDPEVQPGDLVEIF